MNWLRISSLAAIVRHKSGFLTAALAAVDLASCGQHGPLPGQAPTQIASADLLGELNELTLSQQQSLFAAVDKLTIPSYFAILVANASDTPVAIDGTMFTRAKSNLLAQASVYSALAKVYPTIGELRSANGQINGMPTLTDVRAALNSLSPTFGLVGMTTVACQPPAAKTWTPQPVSGKTLRAKNAIEYAGADYSQVGVALKRYQDEADRQQAGWDAWMGRKNLAVQTNGKWSSPVIVTGNPTDEGPTQVQTVGSNGRPDTDITEAAFDCYEQTDAE